MGRTAALTSHDVLASEVETCLREMVHSESETMTRLTTHLLNSGKRLRPRLVLLCAELFYPPDRAAVEVAASVELIHMASLIHDDVIDHAETRRDRPSVNALWGNHLAVLAGDFLFSRAYQLLTRHVVYGVVPVVTGAVADMCIGEMEQAASLYDVNQTEEMYYRRIFGKTASLIKAACKVGALVGQGPESLVETVARFGEELGYAFQILDDINDFIPQAGTGKPVGLDLIQGIITLPMILLLQDASVGDHLRKTISQGDLDETTWEEACRLLRETGALAKAKGRAYRHVAMAKRALQPLPDSPAKRNLLAMADQLLARSW